MTEERKAGKEKSGLKKRKQEKPFSSFFQSMFISALSRNRVMKTLLQGFTENVPGGEKKKKKRQPSFPHTTKRQAGLPQM